MEKKTARQYLDQFPNAKPEKEIDWLGFATDYASQESEPLKDKIKELEGEYAELRRKLHNESARLFTVSFIRDLDQKVSKGDISFSRMIEILNEKVTLQKIDLVNDNKLLYESNCKEREVKQFLSDTNVQSDLTRMREGKQQEIHDFIHTYANNNTWISELNSNQYDLFCSIIRDWAIQMESELKKYKKGIADINENPDNVFHVTALCQSLLSSTKVELKNDPK